MGFRFGVHLRPQGLEMAPRILPPAQVSPNTSDTLLLGRVPRHVHAAGRVRTHNLHPEIPGISLPSIVIVGALDDHHPHPLMSEDRTRTRSCV